MSMDDLRCELRSTKSKETGRTSRNSKRTRDEDEEMANPLREIGVRHDAEDEMERKLAIILAAEVTAPRGRFRIAMDEVYSEAEVKSTTDWTDFIVGKRICYRLRKLKEDEIVSLGDEVFGSLKGKVTARAICQLMLLAYQLKDALGNRVFGTIPDDLVEAYRSFDSISDDGLFTAESTTGIHIALPESDNKARSKIVTAYSYLAGSYMKLFTKSAESYEESEKHLEERFSNFYDFPLPLENFHPDLQVIKSIKIQFEVNTILRNTFYNFLYAGECSDFGEQVKEFLYRMHVSYTGMHSYTMFLRCMNAHQISNTTLCRILDNPGFKKELDGISSIFNTLHGSQNKHGREKQMWRFARIFDNSFYHDLQTKKCVLFVSVLAHLYHIAIPIKPNQNAHNIAGIKNTTTHLKNTARGIAGIAYKKIMMFTHPEDNDV